MPIKIPNDLPAAATLQSENIFVMPETRAITQDIRPLEILILNLMPTKIVTETQFARLLGNTPLQVHLEFLHTRSHVATHVSAEHLFTFYKTFDEVRDRRYDGMIITGAPVEQLPFEDVEYWQELCSIMDWSRTHVHSTLHICWGAQAALYHHYGIEKVPLEKKLFGVFPHRVEYKNPILLRGFDDVFMVPHSRHTTVRREDIERVPELKILASSEQAGVYVSGRYFVKSILVPVQELTATAKRISAGSYGVQIPRKSDDEIGELTDTINEMSEKISRAEKMQSEFVSSVSHELRTPLTAISGWSETLLSAGTGVDSAEARRGLSIIQREAARLTDMVEELLEFTRLQDGRFTLNVVPCDLRTEFEDTVFMYGSRLRQEGIVLDYLENDDDIPEIPCDPARMKQVFLNILDNAAKHGGEGGRITAEICRENADGQDSVVIRIRDFGPGIPEEELPLVKKKFYKGASKARGSGIGLAICEEIVTMHNGVLDIANAEGGGAVVTIRLPIAEQ